MVTYIYEEADNGAILSDNNIKMVCIDEKDTKQSILNRKKILGEFLYGDIISFMDNNQLNKVKIVVYLTEE